MDGTLHELLRIRFMVLIKDNGLSGVDGLENFHFFQKTLVEAAVQCLILPCEGDNRQHIIK